MTGGWKEQIKRSVEYDPGYWDIEEVHSEIDRVYTQAAKADEYEKSKHRTHVNDCKAEAFDAILKAYDEAFSREHMADDVSNIIEKYESGDYDAKKLRSGLLHQMHG